VATTRTVTPGIAPNPDIITYLNPMKIRDVYDDKLLKLAQKHASPTWDNDSFTNQSPKEISDLTAAGGHLTTTSCITQTREDFIQGRLHSKILAHQILSMLTDDARQVIKRQPDEYTWSDSAGLDKEMDGMTIVALILRRLCPHHKVDMYAEIKNIKKLMLAQYDNDVHLFCNAINSKKLAIYMKNPTAYMDDSFVRDLFQVFKYDSLPTDFKSEFTSLERHWQMDKEYVTLQSLMANASSYYTNLVVSGNWKLEINKHAQIIALTTQILDLKSEISQVKTSTKSSGDTGKVLCNKNDNFQRWCLTKIDNGNKFNMVDKDSTKYYWCDKHKHPDSEQSGMYVFHKPTDHDELKKKKDFFNSRKKGNGKPTTTNEKLSTGPPSTTPVASAASTSKLYLAKSLQEALTTTAGLSEDQFNRIWADACDALGN
jgi:hypothetical protein